MTLILERTYSILTVLPNWINVSIWNQFVQGVSSGKLQLDHFVIIFLILKIVEELIYFSHKLWFIRFHWNLFVYLLVLSRIELYIWSDPDIATLLGIFLFENFENCRKTDSFTFHGLWWRPNMRFRQVFFRILTISYSFENMELSIVFQVA